MRPTICRRYDSSEITRNEKGSTDDFGFRADEKPVHVHDLHITMLHVLGFDHRWLTDRRTDRDFRFAVIYVNLFMKRLVRISDVHIE
ncbi:MAG: hypothetical protein CMJ81_12740 [Planctomycetaceae bacterium]|nr:hypothetical protein [Planctomycetaceae bacterium]MBP62228.1 hypothetical protein [Planctomycetaceae bacterium]